MTEVVHGVAPPHSIEAEQSVLGAVLQSEQVHYAYVIEEGLKADDFYLPRHQLIFEAMLDLYGDAQPIDVLTVTEQLRERGKLEAAGGANEVDALTAAVPAVGNLRRYGQIVRERALMRRLLAATHQIQSSIHEPDAPPVELVNRAERDILNVSREDRRGDVRHAGDILAEGIDVWEKVAASDSVLTGCTSGFSELDDVTGGFQEGNLIVIAARPSMGKSALVVNIAENVALHREPRPVLLFSLEMSELELSQRLVASQASIKGGALAHGRLSSQDEWKRVLDASQRFANAPLYIDDSSDVGLTDVRAKTRRLHQELKDQGGLGLVIVDYLQLMRVDARIESRVLQIGEISRGLKILARELKVPVIALSQLSRQVEQRHDRRPILSDLRDSGAIEQDADVVIFIYRDDYYDRDSQRAGEADLIVAKHRNGRIGDVALAFQPQYPRFTTLERAPRPDVAYAAGGF